MQIRNLPNRIVELLDQLKAPSRLVRHLQLVHAMAFDVLTLLKNEWPELEINHPLVLFGAATHDIGKVRFQKELYEGGKYHELEGQRILKEHGFEDTEARFALTHGNWKMDNLELEDLLVCLSDKVWKGKRVEALEERIVSILVLKLNQDFWEVYPKFTSILDKVVTGADERILWQNQ